MDKGITRGHTANRQGIFHQEEDTSVLVTLRFSQTNHKNVKKIYRVHLQQMLLVEGCHRSMESE